MWTGIQEGVMKGRVEGDRLGGEGCREWGDEKEGVGGSEGGG